MKFIVAEPRKFCELNPSKEIETHFEFHFRMKFNRKDLSNIKKKIGKVQWMVEKEFPFEDIFFFFAEHF